MSFFNFALVLLLLYLSLKVNFKNNFFKASFLIIIFLNLIFLGAYFFFDFLSGNGLNEAVIFHLMHGITGFGVDEYIIPGTILFLFFLSSLSILLICKNKIIVNENRENHRSHLLLFSSLTLFFLNPLLIDANKFFSEEFFDPNDNDYFYETNIQFKKNPKNIIFLYLEQFERTYTNNDIFPNLTPNLNRLEEKAISFTNIISPYATNWTIAGMVASQCGIPLLTKIEVANNMGGMDKFLTSATCIGDVLKNNSYDLHYIGGSELEFAGKGKFYDSHGFTSVEGWEELKSRLIDGSYRSPWGLFDDSLYEINMDRLKHFRSSDSPYGLFTLTLDTHHPNGYLSRSCKDIKYQDGTNPILNSIHCADKMAAKFIENIITDKSYKDTVLVVLSDHLALKNTASSQLEDQDRKNLFYIFSQEQLPRKILKPGSMFDVAPTVMNLLGANTIGFGLGRNLFYEKSLIENEIDLTSIIEKNRTRIASMWSFPQLNDGFKVKQEEKKIYFGKRYINLPALILFNKENLIDEIIFDFHYAKPLKTRVKELQDNQKYLWIDECIKMSDKKNNSSLCSILGIANKTESSIIYDYQLLDKDFINNFFDSSKKSFFDK